MEQIFHSWKLALSIVVIMLTVSVALSMEIELFQSFLRKFNITVFGLKQGTSTNSL